MAEEVKESGQGGNQKKGGLKKLLIFIVAGLVVVGLAVFLVITFTSKKGEEKSQIKKETSKPTVIYNLDPIVANLYDPSGKRYIQVRLALALADKKAEEEIKNNEPIIKDVIITYLSAKTPEEVIQPEAKDVMKKELLKRINEALGEDIVLKIYITQYIVE